jgi:hypothetical protein
MNLVVQRIQLKDAKRPFSPLSYYNGVKYSGEWEAYLMFRDLRWNC